MAIASPGEDVRRWQLLKSLLADGMALSAADRAAFVDSCTKDDKELQQELKTLLDLADRPASFEASPLVTNFLHGLERRDDSRIGQRVGAYRVTRLIARGGMGEVYEGVRDDGQYEQRVAIKVVRDGPNRALLIERFDRERRILATLEHPNLSRLIDAGLSASGDPYFVMELVDGLPIDIYCDQKKISMRGRLALMRTVCHVVHYAHSQGVIHRDIKPQNILVTSGGVVKLVDFGIAKRLENSSEDLAGTAVDQRALTPEYASPEHLRGEPLGPASDVYSLGVVLYRLLTGVSPYAPALASSFALTQAICEVEPTRPSAAIATADGYAKRQRLRGDMDAIVLMALRKEPNRRFTGADALADDLFRHIEGFPVLARRGAASYKFSRWVLRHRTTVIAIGAVNVLLIAGILIAGWQNVEIRNQRDRATQNATDLRKLASTLMFDVSDALAREPGTTQARRLIVQNALAYLEKVREQAISDPVAQLDSVRSYRRVGDILGGSSMPNIGEHANALRHYEQAISIAFDLLGNDLTRLGALSELAELHRSKAEMLMLLGQYSEALAAASAAVDEAVVAQAEGMDRAENLLLLARTYGMRARVQSALARSEPFLADLTHSERLARQALAAAPRSLAAGSALVWAIGSLGWFDLINFNDAQHAESSLARYGEGLAIAENLLTPDAPLTCNLARLAANMAVGEGRALQRLGRTPEAVAKFQRSIAYWESRTNSDATDVASRVGLLDVLQELGSALTESHQARPAIDALERAQGIYLELPETAHTSAGTRWGYAQILYSLGLAYSQRAQLKTGRSRIADLEQAEAVLTKAVSVFNEPALATMGFQTDGLTTAAVQRDLDKVRQQLRG
ncbi:protein kinase domain-containing protein [Roseateles sp. NT4]|uniref:serine/threonine protein kinase n=1 Tax=Roseateles sp. NT4 TaxID=3453715 RepID=UPI003EEC36DE